MLVSNGMLENCSAVFGHNTLESRWIAKSTEVRKFPKHFAFSVCIVILLTELFPFHRCICMDCLEHSNDTRQNYQAHKEATSQSLQSPKPTRIASLLIELPSSN